MLAPSDKDARRVARRRFERERKRRYRQHLREGTVCYRISANETDIVEMLLLSGWLDEASGLQKSAVEAALTQLIREWCRRWREEAARA